ncbi:NADH dehydrogenase 1 alpha subcomplex assembly factor 3 [Lipomyces arxii]|uniref:NADH dehydrogenase 1 alpha subcomplex assembly factor 3 n=1 Tax=Lipomyces arxii TaxID=56418 RepID=UPI0034CF4817
MRLICRASRCRLRLVSRTRQARSFYTVTPRREKVLNNATGITPSKGGAIQDFDMLQDLPRPPVSFDSVYDNGFVLSDGAIFDCRENSIGCAIMDGQVLEWDFRPYCKGLDVGMVDIDRDGIKFLSFLYPRPELLLVGLGGKSRILTEKTKADMMSMGYQTEVTDTQNAANNFELLATERPRQVIALLLPPSI